MKLKLKRLLNSGQDQRKNNVEGWEPGMPRQFPVPLDPQGIRFTSYRRKDYHGRLNVIGGAPETGGAKMPGGWTAVPNWFFDDVLTDSGIPGSVKNVFLYIYRQTEGYHRKDWEISLTAIQDNANVSRVTASYAIKVLTDCWGLFVRLRGRKGRHSSTYRYSAPTMEQIYDRRQAVCLAYGLFGGVPSARQLLARPCTREVLNGGYAKLRQKRVGPDATYSEWFPE